MKKIKVLMFALEFPPVNTTGCYRYLKFLKYLHQFDTEITLLVPTVSDLMTLYPNSNIDNTLLNQIPESVKIIEVPLSIRAIDLIIDAIPNSQIKHLIRLGDDNIAPKWKNKLIRTLDVIIPQIKPDIIWGSVPPFSLGRLLSLITTKYKVPLVIDFRDERSLNKSIPFSTFMHYLYAFYTENYVFRNAAKISVVTPQLLEIFRRIHAKVDPNKFYLITNGLDFEEYDSIQFESLPNNGVDKFIIGYSGSYYYDPISHALAAVPAWKRPGMKKISYQQKHTSENWFYRSPYYFFKALRELFDRRADLVDKIEFHHVGHCPHWLNDMVGEFNLSENFITYGFVTKSENISIQKKFNLLLCTSEKLLNEDHYGLSSKVFDYVYLQKPLLGFVTPGITKDFIEKSGCGIICNPDDPIDSSYKIEYLYENRVIFKPDKEFLSAFKPDVLTLRLRSLFDLVLNNQ